MTFNFILGLSNGSTVSTTPNFTICENSIYAIVDGYEAAVLLG
jgi:hypothetical protein